MQLERNGRIGDRPVRTLSRATGDQLYTMRGDAAKTLGAGVKETKVGTCFHLSFTTPSLVSRSEPSRPSRLSHL